MNRMWTRLICWIWLAGLLGVGSASAQDVSIQASVNQTTVAVGDIVEYTLTVEGVSFSSLETPDPPSTEGLTLLHRVPNTRRNISYYNGQMQQSVSFEWRFRPLREGAALIKPLQLQVKGETYETESIRIKAVPRSQAPRTSNQRAPSFNPPSSRRSSPSTRSDGEDEGKGMAPEDLFIQAEPSTNEAYRNEQVTITYRLFFRDGVQVRQSRMADSWDAEGFWREDLQVDPRPLPRHTVQDGVRYRSIVLKKAAVFPTRAGSLRVDPLRIETEAYAPQRSSSNLFQRFFAVDQYETIERASPPVPIRVKPLPRNAPSSFSGAVGTFQLDVQLSDDAVEVGDAVEMTVRLSGTGNLSTLEAPGFTPPDVFDLYEPEIDTDLNRKGSRIQGTKTFTYTLVPGSNGTYDLPDVQFSYFDPEAARYETLTASTGRIRVTGAPTAPPSSATTNAGLPVDDITGILASAGSWQPVGRMPLHRSPWTYVALIVPLVVLMGVYAYQRHTTRLATDPAYARRRRAHPAARGHLKEARQLLEEGEQHAFYAKIHRAVLGFIGDQLNVTERALTREQLEDHLHSAGVPRRTRQETRQLLAACDRARFGPHASNYTTMKATLNRTEQLVQDLDKAFSR